MSNFKLLVGPKRTLRAVSMWVYCCSTVSALRITKTKYLSTGPANRCKRSAYSSAPKWITEWCHAKLLIKLWEFENCRFVWRVWMVWSQVVWLDPIQIIYQHLPIWVPIQTGDFQIPMTFSKFQYENFWHSFYIEFWSSWADASFAPGFRCFLLINSVFKLKRMCWPIKYWFWH